MNNGATLGKFSQLPFGDMIEVVTKILRIIVMVDMYSKHTPNMTPSTLMTDGAIKDIASTVVEEGNN